VVAYEVDIGQAEFQVHHVTHKWLKDAVGNATKQTNQGGYSIESDKYSQKRIGSRYFLTSTPIDEKLNNVDVLVSKICRAASPKVGTVRFSRFPGVISMQVRSFTVLEMS
jgi:hypothetical protein